MTAMTFDVVLHYNNAIRTWRHPNRQLQLARVTAIMVQSSEVVVAPLDPKLTYPIAADYTVVAYAVTNGEMGRRLWIARRKKNRRDVGDPKKGP